MVSEKQKAAARKWDRKNMKSLSCRLRREDAELFKQYCTENNTTPGAVLKNYVRELLEKYSEQLENADNTKHQ